MGEDDVDVGAGPQGTREDQVDGSPGRGQRVVDDGLGEEAADEPGLEVGARRVQEDEGAIGLQLRPYRLETLVAGQFVPVGGVRADAAAELLLREEEVDLGAGALDVCQSGRTPKKPNFPASGASAAVASPPR